VVAPPPPVVIEQSNVCVRRSTAGNFSVFQFEPSEILYDEQRNILIVASLSQILAAPADVAEANAPLQLLYRFPGQEDLEALTFIDGTLYAISEATTNSSLIRFDWTSNSSIVPRKRWGIPSPAAVS